MVAKAITARVRRQGIIESARDKRREQYTNALGRFVDSYAHTESLVHLMFPRLAKLDRTVAMAIKGSMRLGELTGLTKRIMVARKWPPEDRKEVADALDHLNSISSFRDSVLHRGAELEKDGTLLSTNAATLKAIDLLEFVTFNVSDIDNATADLRQIRTRLILVTYKRHLKNYTPESVQAVRVPWRYKPVKRETVHQRVLREMQAHAHQQKSSRG
jgi:hypothetical protein